MRSISEDQFRNALEHDALPIITQLLEVIEKQHEAFVTLKRCLEANEDLMESEYVYYVKDALALGKPFIEKDKHQQRLRREKGEERSQ
jgi:hypothetical protein